MANCIFCNKVCNKRPIFGQNEVEYFLNKKLVQYVLCIFNGPFRENAGRIAPVSNLDINDYINMSCWNQGDSCGVFVRNCIKDIYNIDIGNPQRGEFKNFQIQNIKIIRSRGELEHLRTGSVLLTLQENVGNPDLIQYLQHRGEISREDIKTYTDIEDVPGHAQSVLFSHVFFYLGQLYPTRSLYIGGRNHASHYMPFGVAKFDDMFNLTDSVLTYKQPSNSGSSYLLLAAT